MVVHCAGVAGHAIGVHHDRGQGLARHGHATDGHDARRIADGRSTGIDGLERTADQGIQAVLELELLDVQQRIAAFERRCHQDGSPADAQGIVGLVAAEDGRIDIGATVQVVVAGPAFDLVGTAATIDAVLAISRDDDVIPSPCIGDVVTTLQVEVLVLDRARHRVGGIGAGNIGRRHHARAGNGARTHVGDEDAAVVDMVAGVGDADLDVVGLAASQDRRHDLEHMADTVIFDRQRAGGVVLEIAGGQIRADHAQGMQRVVVEQGVVHAVDDDDRGIDELVHPLGKLVRAEHQIEADRGRAWIADREVEGQRGRVIGLCLEHGIDHGVDVDVSGCAIVGAEPAQCIARTGHGAGSQQQAGAYAERRERAVIEVDCLGTGGVEHHAARLDRDAGISGQQGGSQAVGTG